MLVLYQSLEEISMSQSRSQLSKHLAHLLEEKSHQFFEKALSGLTSYGKKIALDPISTRDGLRLPQLAAKEGRYLQFIDLIATGLSLHDAFEPSWLSHNWATSVSAHRTPTLESSLSPKALATLHGHKHLAKLMMLLETNWGIENSLSATSAFNRFANQLLFYLVDHSYVNLCRQCIKNIKQVSPSFDFTPIYQLATYRNETEIKAMIPLPNRTSDLKGPDMKTSSGEVTKTFYSSMEDAFHRKDFVTVAQLLHSSFNPDAFYKDAIHDNNLDLLGFVVFQKNTLIETVENICRIKPNLLNKFLNNNWSFSGVLYEVFNHRHSLWKSLLYARIVSTDKKATDPKCETVLSLWERLSPVDKHTILNVFTRWVFSITKDPSYLTLNYFYKTTVKYNPSASIKPYLPKALTKQWQATLSQLATRFNIPMAQELGLSSISLEQLKVIQLLPTKVREALQLPPNLRKIVFSYCNAESINFIDSFNIPALSYSVLFPDDYKRWITDRQQLLQDLEKLLDENKQSAKAWSTTKWIVNDSYLFSISTIIGLLILDVNPKIILKCIQAALFLIVGAHTYAIWSPRAQNPLESKLFPVINETLQLYGVQPLNPVDLLQGYSIARVRLQEAKERLIQNTKTLSDAKRTSHRPPETTQSPPSTETAANLLRTSSPNSSRTSTLRQRFFGTSSSSLTTTGNVLPLHLSHNTSLGH